MQNFHTCRYIQIGVKIDFQRANKSSGALQAYMFRMRCLLLIFSREKRSREAKKMLIPDLFSLTTPQRKVLDQLFL